MHCQTTECDYLVKKFTLEILNGLDVLFASKVDNRKTENFEILR